MCRAEVRLHKASERAVFGPPSLLNDTRAARILRKQEGRNKRETTAMRFPEGAPVDIVSGTFAGYHGLVRGVTGKGLVVVMLQMFGGLVPVERDAGELEMVA